MNGQWYSIRAVSTFWKSSWGLEEGLHTLQKPITSAQVISGPRIDFHDLSCQAGDSVLRTVGTHHLFAREKQEPKSQSLVLTCFSACQCERTILATEKKQQGPKLKQQGQRMMYLYSSLPPSLLICASQSVIERDTLIGGSAFTMCTHFLPFCSAALPKTVR